MLEIFRYQPNQKAQESFLKEVYSFEECQLKFPFVLRGHTEIFLLQPKNSAQAML